MNRAILKNIALSMMLLVLLLTGGCQTPKGQQRLSKEEKSKLKLYRKEPKWIDMMNDPNANYFETIKAFEAFWAGRKLPEEEGEEKGENGDESIRREKDAKEGQQYAFEYKKFKNWRRVSEPFVQPDGSILNADQRLEIWKQQQQQKKQ
ncbi:hypothetical protein [Solitalea lacus]|uniref:hypothetical protein n=1 Tax=Solitalea lacus TaxID=2911172 RepID=UPI001EDABFD4|nr:hypothetical protein [Solitalea lacus]UKJ07483.1 hypothetical protein L2B55_18435 [Solitalea lacus]